MRDGWVHSTFSIDQGNEFCFWVNAKKVWQWGRYLKSWPEELLWEQGSVLMPERDASDGRHKNMAQHLSGGRTSMWQWSEASDTLCQAAWHTHHPVAELISELTGWVCTRHSEPAASVGTTHPASSWLSAVPEVSFWKNVAEPLWRKKGHR